MEPKQQQRLAAVALVVAGAVVGAAVVEYARGTQASPAAQGEPTAVGDEVERLKTLVPSQSHSMLDVGEHWSNLWFAAQQKNWPLAQFYFAESRAHIQWTIRIRPIRKDPDGKDVDIRAIFDAIDASSFASVRFAIAQKDSAKFESAYRVALDSCYSCHKSSGMPYLRPLVPQQPGQSIIDFAPVEPGPS